MNRNLIRVLTIGALLLLVSIPNIYAQTTLRATVPFPFMVGKTEVPAGTYTIDTISPSAIAIRDRCTGKGVLSLVIPEQPGRSDGTPKLVFNKYGSRYFLSQVSRGLGGNVMQLPPSKLEKELRIASARSAPEQKMIVASK
jgi:hypothetical protein